MIEFDEKTINEKISTLITVLMANVSLIEPPCLNQTWRWRIRVKDEGEYCVG